MTPKHVLLAVLLGLLAVVPAQAGDLPVVFSRACRIRKSCRELGGAGFASTLSARCCRAPRYT